MDVALSLSLSPSLSLTPTQTSEDSNLIFKSSNCMESFSSFHTLRCQDRRPASAPVAGITSTIPPMMKARQHLQLPPFNSLGIAAPFSNFLLTPPDENEIIKWNASSRDPLQIPSSTSVPPSNKFTSKGTTTKASHLDEFISGNVPNTSPPPETPPQGRMAAGGTSSGLGDSDRRTWVEETVDVASKPGFVPTHQTLKLIGSSFCCYSGRFTLPCTKRALPRTTMPAVR